MKVYTSYFYQVRFFPKNAIALSTAIWDPKWFHDFKGQSHVFVDKRGVMNGLRATPFAPGASCDGLCRGKELCQTGRPQDCKFLQEYEHQLDSLSLDDILQRMEVIGEKVRAATHFEGEPIFILLVHEAPNNPCSERVKIQEFFNKRGIPCSEWCRGAVGSALD